MIDFAARRMIDFAGRTDEAFGLAARTRISGAPARLVIAGSRVPLASAV
jgi:hypothetical protein